MNPRLLCLQVGLELLLCRTCKTWRLRATAANHIKLSYKLHQPWSIASMHQGNFFEKHAFSRFLLVVSYPLLQLLKHPHACWPISLSPPRLHDSPAFDLFSPGSWAWVFKASSFLKTSCRSPGSGSATRSVPRFPRPKLRRCRWRKFRGHQCRSLR